MRKARRESWPSRRKKRRKKIEEVRSSPCVPSEVCSSKRRQPRPAGPLPQPRRDRPGPPRPGRPRSVRRPQVALACLSRHLGRRKCVRGPAGQGASCPRPQHGIQGFHESRDTRHESRTLWPFHVQWERKGRITKNRRPVTVSLRPFAWHGAASRGKGRPEQLSAHRPQRQHGL